MIPAWANIMEYHGMNLFFILPFVRIDFFSRPIIHSVMKTIETKSYHFGKNKRFVNVDLNE